MLLRGLLLQVEPLQIGLGLCLHVLVEVCVQHLRDLTFILHPVMVQLVPVQVLWSFLGAFPPSYVSVLLVPHPNHIILEKQVSCSGLTWR